jgi:hypothetical protein
VFPTPPSPPATDAACPLPAGAGIIGKPREDVEKTFQEDGGQHGRQRPAVAEGYHAVTPDLVVQDAAEAIEFYKKAFGAEERARMATPDGEFLVHAELQIGDSKVFLVDQMLNAGQKSHQSMEGPPSPSISKWRMRTPSGAAPSRLRIRHR